MECPFKSQTTLRLRDEDLKHIQELWPDFEFPSDMRVSEAFVKIYDMALNKRPTQSKPEDLQKIKELTLQIEELNAEKIDLENKISAALQEAANGKLPAGAVVLNFDPATGEYYRNIVELLASKPESGVKGYEDLFKLMLEVYHHNKLLILDEKDMKELETIRSKRNGSKEAN